MTEPNGIIEASEIIEAGQAIESGHTIEPDAIEFREPIGKPGSKTRGPLSGRSTPLRVGMAAGSALLLVVGAVAAMGASPTPSTGADPAASGAPGQVTPLGKGDRLGDHDGPLGGMGRGFRDITISSINGSSISLKTDDGWTRTIDISTSTITKGGTTIAVGDLAVGDQVRFAQTRATDGTYSVTAINVVLPTVVGQVTAIDGDTLTITQPGGTTATVHLAAGTTYKVDGADGTKADVKVGSFVLAEGTQRTDGSLDAAAVRTGTGDHGGFGGRVFRGGHDGGGGHDGQPDPLDSSASPAPSTSAS